MLGFLQGFAYGLWLSCLPWLAVGLVNPALAVPSEPPRRWKVLLRYAVVVPFLAFVLWLTSLWGGFSPTLLGWLAGLAAVAVSLPLERRWHRRRAARRAAAAAQALAGSVRVLNPAHPPAEADEVVRALAGAKQELIDVRRHDLAGQADRVFTRYTHVLEVLGSKFDAREVTYERARGLAAQVARGAVDNLTAMAAQAGAARGLETEAVHRRLHGREALPPAEREALERRLALAQDTERRIQELAARNEAVLTALDHAAVAVARVRTGPSQAAVAADEALRELRRFVDKAEAYGRGA